MFSPKALEFYGKINFMKGGLVYADLLNTVSTKYREEILTPAHGFGLEGVLQERSQDLFGIVEGVDYQRWDPAVDPFIPASYSGEELAGKKVCRQALIEFFDLDLPEGRPLLGMTTRLCQRKGIDLVENILDDLMRLNVGFVLQGTGEERHQYLLQEISRRHPGRIGLFIGYREDLAHQIIAGTDIFLMPSQYEPCGLDQLYCLRYGTVPVVRATGGLDETIAAYDPQTGQGSGFKFSGYTPAEFLGAVQQALSLYEDQEAWRRLIQNNMKLNFSWDLVAPKYVDLYHKALEKRRQLIVG
ncbi:MAG: glycogen/starch synthase [Deltaproteobacteria bacterium]|nr:glycogen/starch synthase [Deltaproteobacteria bacterium]